jgi:hypothetical protein
LSDVVIPLIRENVDEDELLEFTDSCDPGSDVWAMAMELWQILRLTIDDSLE